MNDDSQGVGITFLAGAIHILTKEHGARSCSPEQLNTLLQKLGDVERFFMDCPLTEEETHADT